MKHASRTSFTLLLSLDKAAENNSNEPQNNEKNSSVWCLNALYLFPAYMYPKQTAVNYKYTYQDSLF